MWRGLIKDHTDIDEFSARLDAGPIALYCGYDPTAESLHIGNLQMIVMLRRFQLAGHRIIPLAGGGTGLIGDPSGRTEERQLRSLETVAACAVLIERQLAGCLGGGESLAPPLFVNNLDWIGKTSAVEFLRDVGKHFTVNYMLAKDSVSSRLGNADAGLSYTEFSYMLLQAYDYLCLHRDHGCELQIGGSDQWGNITAGISLVKKITGHTVYGLTSPLILRSDGKKFGKSETGAVWLARDKTSPFTMYQYFLNIPDTDAAGLLRRLTLLVRAEIESIEQSMAEAPQQRLAQRRLAEEVVRFVHGEEALDEANHVTRWLFGGEALATDRGWNFAKLLAGAPCHEVDPSAPRTWDALLAESAIASSKSDARRLIQGGGIYAWDQRVERADQQVDLAGLHRDGVIVVSKGKKNKTVIRIAGT
jgi:tyrosyl-tRNA synthetase